jgi:hypothetical protein
MTTSYCDICKEAVVDYMFRKIIYQDDSPQYNGDPAKRVTLEVCPECNEKTVGAIKEALRRIKEL